MQPFATNQRLQNALLELVRHEERGSSPYWWREASMYQLAAEGLTEKYQPCTIRPVMAYRSTLAGREAAAKLRQDD